MRRISVVLRIAAIVPLLFVTPSADAQTAPPPQPLVVETIPTGWVLAPDFKATESESGLRRSDGESTRFSGAATGANG